MSLRREGGAVVARLVQFFNCKVLVKLRKCQGNIFVRHWYGRENGGLGGGFYLAMTDRVHSQYLCQCQ